MASDKVLIGVIGGSGLYHLDNLTTVETVHPETPWGFPSSPITICALPSGVRVAFIARHGLHHTHPPSSVPSRANIAALKHLGVRVVLAFSAVGSLREHIHPGHFALPTQILDRTKGVRPASFFEGTTVVAHAAFGEPFSGRLVRWLEGALGRALESVNMERRRTGVWEAAHEVVLHRDACIVCMEGPQFSTRAESVLYRAWGGDVINMSVLPEAKLAREAELGYALIATATDYDSWRPHEGVVTASQVIQTLKSNADTARYVAAAILDDLHRVVEAADKGEGESTHILGEEQGSMAFSIMPRSAHQKEEDVAKLAYVLPEYFKLASGTPN